MVIYAQYNEKLSLFVAILQYLPAVQTIREALELGQSRLATVSLPVSSEVSHTGLDTESLVDADS